MIWVVLTVLISFRCMGNRKHEGGEAFMCAPYQTHEISIMERVFLKWLTIMEGMKLKSLSSLQYTLYLFLQSSMTHCTPSDS